MNKVFFDAIPVEHGCFFKVDYHPIIQAMFERITAYDASVSLSSPHMGFIPYKKFRPIAEKTDMNEFLEQCIFEKVCRMVNGLIREKKNFEYVSVNISALYLKNENYISDLLEILNETDVSPEKICLEISENAFKTDYDNMIERMHVLKKAGFLVAIDDYSADIIPLLRLDGVPADIIKIDKALTDRISVDKKTENTINAIVERTRELKRELIMKASERLNNKYLLMSLGCEKIQGYLCEVPADTNQETTGELSS